MADVEFSLIGLDALLGKLDAVKQDVKRRGGRFALRKAANIIAQKAKEGALQIDDPLTGRSIAQNIAIRFGSRAFRATGDLTFRIGILRGAVLAEMEKGNPDKGLGSATPHWRLLEFGTQYMRAQPFMRPALENSISAVTSTFITEYEKALDRAIKRAAKQAQGG